MESLLIFIAIFVIDALIKRANAKKKALEEKQLHEDSNENANEETGSSEEQPPEPSPSAARKLQEYIKQFEEAQREASQGTLEPAMPPPIPDEPRHAVGNNVTLREVAEDVILMDCVDVEYLMDEFEMSEGTAIAMLYELQNHRIIGRDMGDGECDVLVHDELELNNLLSREPHAKEKAAAASAPAEAASRASEKQSQLKILEERARKAREEAAEAARQSDIENGYAGETVDSGEFDKKPAVRTFNRESVRRGFIWGKVIDEPRFKRRWSPAHR